MESKRPLTRETLEAMIAEAKAELQKAVDAKAYTECGPLQAKLDDLEKKREDMPSLAELQQAVAAAEKAVADAAKNRDFAAAASYQKALAEARKKLDETMEANGDSVQQTEVVESDVKPTMFSYKSRCELEEAIEDACNELDKAVNSNNFEEAARMQTVVEERESLRQYFPSVAELELELKQNESDLQSAISLKQFDLASKLHKAKAEISARLASERTNVSTAVRSNTSVSAVLSDGETHSFDCRADLEDKLVNIASLIAKCVKERAFKEAEHHQSDADKLTKLKEKLPSLADIVASIRSKQEEMERSIMENNFARAEQLHLDIECLKKDKAKEEANMEPTQLASSVQSSTKAIGKRNTVAGDSYVTPMAPRNKRSLMSPTARSVSNLRPPKPIIWSADDTVLTAAKSLAAKRESAGIVVGPGNSLLGILTDTDITRRLVGKRLDPHNTLITSVMTSSPTCVSKNDSAMDALTIMVENRFRHLPVTNDDGSVMGVLDIKNCLNAAITKLERAHSDSASAADNVLNSVMKGGKSQADADALKALLGAMTKAFGAKSMPTLRSMLAGKPSVLVYPSETVEKVGHLMAENRKAAIIVDENTHHLLGIFGFKDMMTRVIAKERHLASTPVSAVMTQKPESVPPDMSVLEALQIMHDNRFLTLPVCESDGRVVGIVDVMDVIYGCGGSEGWRSVFAAAMEVEYDGSVASSEKAGASTSQVSSTHDAPVSRLRPSKPITSNSSESVSAVAKRLAEKRQSATIVINENNQLVGILTDSDITRRVVVKSLGASQTYVHSVMTPDPKCVVLEDSALNALGMMVENHFHHLPVVDSNGSVVGLLDIGKCLHSAISKLEQGNQKSPDAAGKLVETMVAQKRLTGNEAEALNDVLASILGKAFNGISHASVRSLITSGDGIISASENTLHAGTIMAKTRHSVAVTEDGVLVGVFGFKEMMNRVVAKDSQPGNVTVGEVMVQNPDTINAESSVLEALQQMHMSRTLCLPVCEDNGDVIGVVDVMDVIVGSGGADGWKAVFSSSLEVADDVSVESSITEIQSLSVKKEKSDAALVVSKLRPSKAVLSMQTDTILSVTQLLCRKRAASTVIVDDEGLLVGILTDTDITRRVVSKDIDPETTPVLEVMTPKPLCVSLSDPAMDALTTMVENHIRHLPVLDGQGSVAGLLDIAKCLNAAISRLEKVHEEGKQGSSSEMMMQAITQNGATGDQAEALKSLLGAILSQSLGNEKIPTVRGLLASKPSTIVGPTATVREVSKLMSETRKAALIVENGTLVGVFGFKDMMTRVVAKQLSWDETEVSQVMTPDPSNVLPDISLLEALQVMHDEHFLTLPVCESDGSVVGLVDVMDVIYGCGGSEGWRSVFTQAMGSGSSDASFSKSRNSVQTPAPGNRSFVATTPPTVAKVLPSNIPTTLEFNDHTSVVGSTIDERGLEVSEGMGSFKIICSDGKSHRIKTELKFADVRQAVAEKMTAKPSDLDFHYVDDEGDIVQMTSDEDVVDVWMLARKSGGKVAKINVTLIERNSTGLILLAGGGVLCLVAAGVAFALARPSRR